MMKRVAMFFVAVGMVAAANALERGTLARFEGGIGVIPVSSGAGTPNPDGTLPNAKPKVVRGISPAGAPLRTGPVKFNALLTAAAPLDFPAPSQSASASTRCFDRGRPYSLGVPQTAHRKRSNGQRAAEWQQLCSLRALP